MTLGPRIDWQQTTHFYLNKSQVQDLVNELNSTEDACGWTYRLAEAERGYFIRIFDETNTYLGTL